MIDIRQGDLVNFFAKASDMLGGDGSASHRGGLYILHGLIWEKSIVTCIPCIDVLTDWLRRKDNDLELIKMAIIIFREAMEELSQRYIEKHKERYNLSLWPNLQNANLEKLDLANLDLQNANMQGVRLSGALISRTNMENAKGLTVEQVVQATWIDNEKGGSLPTLPADLQYSHELRRWFDNPPFPYQHDKKHYPIKYR